MKNRKSIILILILSNLLSMSYLANADDTSQAFLISDNKHNNHNHKHHYNDENGLIADINITASIKRKLFEDSDVNSARVHVVTEHGRVTLSGTVTDNQIKEKVISIAKNTKGVKEVVSRVEIGSKSITSDTRITTLIKLRLLEDEHLSSLDIHVETINGKVTLTGFVPDEASKERAISIAEMTNGVTSVNSQLKINKTEAGSVKSVVSDSIITANLKISFLEDEYLDGLDIHIKTVKGKVTLTGTVPDEACKQRAILIAKLTNGVKHVESKLHVKEQSF